MTLMMLIISVVCVLKTLDRYNWLAEYLCSVNYVQTYVFQILEENLNDMAHFRGYRLFPGWFQVMPVVSWLVSDSFWMVSGGFRLFQVVSACSSF